jgi:hypothetical protein
MLWHDCYLNDHPNCSWAELKRAFCKRYGGEPWQEQIALEQRGTIILPQLTKGLVNQQKGDSAQLSQQQDQTRKKDQELWRGLEEQDQWWLSPAVDPTLSWKPEHPANEE